MFENNKLINYCFFRYFVEEEPIWKKDKSLVLKEEIGVDDSISQYTGGMIQVFVSS